jgi:NADH-quinone oxidoreductase subunit C
MFGIRFTGHNDLRRILTDYGFRGRPLRKDYPICGFSEYRYSTTCKCVMQYDVHLVQDLRW